MYQLETRFARIKIIIPSIPSKNVSIFYRKETCMSFVMADYYADPIPSFRFWSGRKNKTLSCKIETGFLCGDNAQIVLFFARVIQQLVRFFDSENSTQRRLLRCPAPRRAHSLGPGLEHPSLRSDSSLAAKRRADALHVVFICNKASGPSTRAAALCVISHDTKPRKTGALLSLFSRSEPASTDS